MDIDHLGWNNFHQENYTACLSSLGEKQQFRPGRILSAQAGLIRVMTEGGEVEATLPGRFRNEPGFAGQFPTVGDWAVLGAGEPAALASLLPRKSRISRNAAGPENSEQVLAANVDYAFIVCSLNKELNFRRIERFLVAAYDGGASPVILLNKSDLRPDAESQAAELEARSPGVPVHVMSALDGRGLDVPGKYVKLGSTCVFLGSSGVGKSTIINRLLGDEAVRTAGISHYKDRGRHTTSIRSLYFLENGGMVIDTPGLREFQIWDGVQGIAETFPEIEELAGQCRFGDCRHEQEPGCAVKQAVESGKLDPDRVRSYRKILREAQFHLRRQSVRLRLDESRRWKAISKSMRHYDKGNRFRD